MSKLSLTTFSTLGWGSVLTPRVSYLGSVELVDGRTLSRVGVSGSVVVVVEMDDRRDGI